MESKVTTRHFTERAVISQVGGYHKRRGHLHLHLVCPFCFQNGYHTDTNQCRRALDDRFSK